MKRKLLILLALCLAFSSLTGCAGNGEPERLSVEIGRAHV